MIKGRARPLQDDPPTSENTNSANRNGIRNYVKRESEKKKGAGEIRTFFHEFLECQLDSLVPPSTMKK